MFHGNRDGITWIKRTFFDKRCFFVRKSQRVF